MQINLIPKTREQEEKRKQVNSVIVIVSISIIAAIVLATAILYGINVSKKSDIKNADKKISGLRSDIGNYKDVETSINALVQDMGDIKSILDGRKDLTFVYRNLQILFPREARMKNLTLNSSKATFDIEAGSYSKISEVIKSLEDYEVEPLHTDTAADTKDTTTKEVAKKVKMFTHVDVSKFAHTQDAQTVTYSVSITADISEDIWQTIN